MKRTIVAALLALIAPAVFAERYLVATKRPFRDGTIRAVASELRGVAGFQTFDGFAAELTEAEVGALRKSRDVRWIEPVLERHAFGVVRNQTGQTVPYGVDLVRAREAWAGKRSGTVNVVVIDTGVDPAHAELKDFWAGGYNVLNPSAPPVDEPGHGTHVAGTITAADNDAGVVGIAPGVRLWGVKVLNAVGSGTTESVIKGIDWVIAKKTTLGGNWIINLSLGSTNGSPAERESISRALDAGILIVAATGNESFGAVKAPVAYPAAYPGVIAVGAVDAKLDVAEFSNQGPEIDLVAPGVEILSTLPVGSVFITGVIATDREYIADPLIASGTGHVTAEFVYCGLGHPEQIPAGVRGKIAVIKRGEIAFAVKARNAAEAGAAAVIIFNSDDSTINWTLLDYVDNPWVSTYTFPIVLALSREDGEALIGRTGAITAMNDPDDYGVASGTSMSAPHVTGAAALIWAMAPQATATDVLHALVATAIDRGTPGHDPAYGAGMLDVLAAARLLAPTAFHTGPSTGRPIGKRGRG